MNSRTLLVLSCLVPVACSPASGGTAAADNGNRGGLVGGMKAIGYDSVIWMKFQCTATRIGPKQLLTASHCVGNIGPLTYWTQADITDDEGDAVLGEPRKNNIVSIARAPGNASGWNKPYEKGEPDFMILELESELPSNVSTATLEISPVVPGDSVTIVGHGCDSQYGKQLKPTVLKQLTLQVLSEAESGVKASDAVHPVYFMTKADQSQGICAGDSGGPVFRGSFVVGVNSFTSSGITLVPTVSGHSRLSVADTSFWTSRGITPIGTPNPVTPGGQPSDPNKTPTNGSGGSAGGDAGSGGTGGDYWGSGGTGGDYSGSGGTGGDYWGSGGDGGGTSSSGSCYGYCGSSDAVPGSNPACYCDANCWSNGDCCADAWTCP